LMKRQFARTFRRFAINANQCGKEVGICLNSGKSPEFHNDGCIICKNCKS
jgi:hypothetical protein